MNLAGSAEAVGAAEHTLASAAARRVKVVERIVGLDWKSEAVVWWSDDAME